MHKSYKSSKTNPDNLITVELSLSQNYVPASQQIFDNQQTLIMAPTNKNDSN